MFLSGKALRNFAIVLLDDKYGINPQAWNILRDILYDDGDCADILESVKEILGRYYLSEESNEPISK